MLVLKLSCKNLTTGIEVLQATPVVDKHMIKLMTQIMMTNLGPHIDSTELCLGLYELDSKIGVGIDRCTPSMLIAESTGPYMLNGTHYSNRRRVTDAVSYAQTPTEHGEPLGPWLMRERDRSIRVANDMFISLVQEI